jgi:hypothetical protein
MKNETVIIALLLTLTNACFNKKDIKTIPIDQNISKLIRTYQNETTIIELNGDSTIKVSPTKYHLNRELFNQWLSGIKKVPLTQKNSIDLSKMTIKSTLEFKSQSNKTFLEVFSINKNFFIKYHHYNDTKSIRGSGFITQEQYKHLVTDFFSMKSNNIYIPSPLNKMMYVINGKEYDITEDHANSLKHCLETFVYTKSIARGNLSLQRAYALGINKQINSNIRGHILIKSSTNTEIHFGKPLEDPTIVRIWSKSQYEIMEGKLPCFSKIRKLDEQYQ